MTDRNITCDIHISDKNGIRQDTRSSHAQTWAVAIDEATRSLSQAIDKDNMNVGAVCIFLTRRWE